MKTTTAVCFLVILYFSCIKRMAAEEAAINYKEFLQVSFSLQFNAILSLLHFTFYCKLSHATHFLHWMLMIKEV